MTLNICVAHFKIDCHKKKTLVDWLCCLLREEKKRRQQRNYEKKTKIKMSTNTWKINWVDLSFFYFTIHSFLNSCIWIVSAWYFHIHLIFKLFRCVYINSWITFFYFSFLFLLRCIFIQLSLLIISFVTYTKYGEKEKKKAENYNVLSIVWISPVKKNCFFFFFFEKSHLILCLICECLSLVYSCIDQILARKKCFAFHENFFFRKKKEKHKSFYFHGTGLND